MIKSSFFFTLKISTMKIIIPMIISINILTKNSITTIISAIIPINISTNRVFVLPSLSDIIFPHKFLSQLVDYYRANF